jgi:hypothetical protein
MDIHPHRLIADISVAFHFLPGIIIDRCRVLHRQNYRTAFHAPDCRGPVRVKYFAFIELFVVQQIVDGWTLVRGLSPVRAASVY